MKPSWSRALFVLASAAALLLPARAPADTVGTTPSETRFILALYEGPAFDRGGSHVPEYVAWAETLRRNGTKVEGEEIGGAGMSLSRDGDSVRVETEGAGGERLAGYFVITARNMDEAIRIARSCPHVRHRGRVVVRTLVR